MRHRGRPDPVRSFGDQACADRVAFDVSECEPKVREVEGTGVEAALPGVSVGAVASVPVGGVASVRLLEGGCERVGEMGNGDEMNVVGHDAEAEYRQTMQG